MPLIEKPSEMTSVTISAISVAMRATPPRADDCRFRSWFAMNGVINAKTTVKMMTSSMNDVAWTSMPSRKIDATIRPNAFESNITPVRTRKRTIAAG